MRIKTIERIRHMAALRADRWFARGKAVMCEARLIATVEREEDARYLAMIHNAILPLVNQLVMWYRKLKDREDFDAVDIPDEDDPTEDAPLSGSPSPAARSSISRSNQRQSGRPQAR